MLLIPLKFPNFCPTCPSNPHMKAPYGSFNRGQIAPERTEWAPTWGPKKGPKKAVGLLN